MLRLAQWVGSSAVSETSFEVVYDGPALGSGEMAVRDLAPALLALGEMFTQGSAILYPDREPASLHIRTTREGSFVVHLVLDASTWKHVIDFLSGDALTALLNLRDVVLVGSTSLFMLIRRIAGRKVVSKTQTEPGTVRLELEGGTVIEGVPADVVTLFEHVSMRDNAREVIEPLRREGIERFEARTDGVTRLTVEKDDIEAFQADLGDAKPVSESLSPNVLLTVLKPSFSDHRWRVTPGSDSEAFWAEMRDEAFLARVARGESFQAGDRLRADLRMVQSELPSGRLQITRSIEYVSDHIRQLQLGDGSGTGSSDA